MLPQKYRIQTVKKTFNHKNRYIMKEKFLEAFANLGFLLKDTDGSGYVFDYEGMHLVYMYNEIDEEFFTIALPGFYDYEESKSAQYYTLAEKINSTLKYVKAYTLSDSMWLFYERELFGEEDLEPIIQHMVMRLEHGLMFARKAIEEIEAETDDNSNGNHQTEDESNDNEDVADDENDDNTDDNNE